MEKKKDIEKSINNFTLKLFNVGSDVKNFNILSKLPSTTSTLAKEIKLTKMPLNKRINELKKVGLVERDKRKGKVNPTKLTKSFIQTINKVKNQVLKNLENGEFRLMPVAD